MLETVKFPTGISNLGSSLADMDRDAFPLVMKMFYEESPADSSLPC